MNRQTNKNTRKPLPIQEVDSKYLLIVDLEATCDEGENLPREHMEIIEIAGCIMDMSDLSIKDELSLFVRPTLNPKLSDFCTRLTSITQSDVDNADTLDIALPLFTEWATSKTEANYTFGSWGEFDFKHIERESRLKKIQDTGLTNNTLNIKLQFSNRRGVKRRFGIKKALGTLDMTFEGTHHRGIDDVRNIARLIPYIYG